MGDVNEDDQGETFDEKKWGDEQDQEEEEEDQSVRSSFDLHQRIVCIRFLEGE